jgi:ATP-dependent DNA ligase
MEATFVDALPDGDGWQYEPKWNGFRCLVFRRGNQVDLRAKSSKPLARYFPDVVRAMTEIPIDDVVFDGELVIPHRRRHVV